MSIPLSISPSPPSPAAAVPTTATTSWPQGDALIFGRSGDEWQRFLIRWRPAILSAATSAASYMIAPHILSRLMYGGMGHYRSLHRHTQFDYNIRFAATVNSSIVALASLHYYLCGYPSAPMYPSLSSWIKAIISSSTNSKDSINSGGVPRDIALAIWSPFHSSNQSADRVLQLYLGHWCTTAAIYPFHINDMVIKGERMAAIVQHLVAILPTYGAIINNRSLHFTTLRCLWEWNTPITNIIYLMETMINHLTSSPLGITSRDAHRSTIMTLMRRIKQMRLLNVFVFGIARILPISHIWRLVYQRSNLELVIKERRTFIGINALIDIVNIGIWFRMIKDIMPSRSIQ
jgi:hypothetical protein